MPKIAIVHEWLTTYAGSERVLEQLLIAYPDADLFAVADFLPEGERGFLQGKIPRTTFLQRFPLARRHLRQYLGLMPLAIEGLDLRGYDIVISSSHAVAKGVLTGPDQFHLCYCHSPLRYAWDLQEQYLQASGMGRWGVKRGVARALLHYLRMWDARSAMGVDQFVANSRYIARRIRKAYGREAVVIPPPVDVDAFAGAAAAAAGITGSQGDDSYYIAISRMVPYKRVDLIVEAFAAAMPGRRRLLKVVGEGPMAESIRRRWCGAGGAPNIEFLGTLSGDVLRAELAGARALVFAAEEDFGITVAESLAAGTPVILFGRGGATEIVEEGLTGVFFDEQTVGSLTEAVLRFERVEHLLADGERMRASVEMYHPRMFRRRFDELLRQSYEIWSASPHSSSSLPRGARRMIQSDR